jgi:hypothetical protein
MPSACYSRGCSDDEGGEGMTDGRRGGAIRGVFGTRFRPFVEITRKYKTPRIKMTRSVKIALLALRLYLIVMIGILVFKFFTSI